MSKVQAKNKNFTYAYYMVYFWILNGNFDF